MHHNTTRTRSPLVFVLLAGIAATALAPSAHAQNALGDGRALDRNLSTQGRFNNSRGSFADDLRFRNAVVTGNVGGGRSFRGDVGYTGGGDFRGDLGSNDIFTFRRESSFSGQFNSPALRGLSGLNTNIGLTAGYNPEARSAAGSANRNAGGFLVARDGAGVSASSLQGFDPLTGARRGPRPASNLYSAPEMVDDRSLDFSVNSGGGVGSLRSTSTQSTLQSLTPSLVGQRREYDGTITNTTASSLRGVRASSFLPDGSPAPTTPPAFNPAVPAAPTGAISQSTLNPAAARSPTLLQTRTAYDRVLDRYAEAAPDPSAPTVQTGSTELDWRAKLDALRATVDGGASRSTTLPTSPTSEPRTAPALPTEVEPEATRGASSIYDQATIDMIRARAGQTDRLLLNDEARLGVFGERMRRAEVAMAEGRFFDAEEAYTVCLTVRPGDVAASIGRIHAQIGAGMYLSGALNLRLLLSDHPEIIGERYGKNIRPNMERIQIIIADLRRYIEADDTLSKQSALILAYIGFQTNDLAMTQEALDVLDTLVEDADARFATLLREIWIPILKSPQPPPDNQPPGAAPDGGADDPG